MNQLEDSTIDLIHRRHIRNHHPATLMAVMVVAVAAALPAIQVDITAHARGMVRPVEEPVPLGCPVNGIVERSVLRKDLRVAAGDTLVWFRRDQLDARIAAHRHTIETGLQYCQDIEDILDDRYPARTARYRQSYQNHLSELTHLQFQEDYLQDEFSIAEKLFREEVISFQDYRKAQSDFRVMHARLETIREGYRNRLEEELLRLRHEIRDLEDDIELLLSQSKDYVILAPAGGTVQDCPGIKPGSVLHAGASMGLIFPLQEVAAECYLKPGDVTVLKAGARVKLRFDDPGFRSVRIVESVVEHIDEDVTLLDGHPVYRVRCPLDGCILKFADGSNAPLRSGMTFTARILLFRQSLLSIMLRRLQMYTDPAGTSRADGA